MYSSRVLTGVELDRKDYGTSFADFLTECDIEGHVIKEKSPEWKYSVMEKYNVMAKTNTKYMEKCGICNMERSITEYDVKGVVGEDGISRYVQKPTEYGEWNEGKKCWECDESCMINKPINNPICPTCATPNIADNDSINGIYHVGKNETILYDCHVCNNQDQIIE